MDYDIPGILNAFGIDPPDCEVIPVGTGHVHDTFIVQRCGNDRPPLILQRINNFVFKDVELLMRNLELVTTHIADKNRKSGLNPACNGIVFLENSDGNSWIKCPQNGYWRMCWFIENQTSFDIVPNQRIAFEGGKTVANFQRLLSDLDPEKIGDSIPDFHNLEKRIVAYNHALENGDPMRIQTSKVLIDQLCRYKNEAMAVYEDTLKRQIPLRITHNDTKFNNILFHKSSQTANCMIDLDTVMKGYTWFDFGDALRTAGNMSAEDEHDQSLIDFRMDVFQGFAEGYMESAANFLTDDEISLLYRAPAVFAFAQSIRFLTDYLTYDPYYKISFPEHNLHRATAQFTLMKKIKEKEPVMEKIIANAIN